ncbi:hypothetical protein [Corynebacterium cystitidis]|uniref:hypothetical protein n=1 Tax=Corynebacterium cystitidis TaxID=35757 RepID=UPI00211DF887|nr:hypothetical protein [Corynebacterium cystitidis]
MKKLKVVAVMSVLSLGLASCGEDTAPPPNPDMGGATPQASPQDASPDGEVVEFAAVRDLDRTGDSVGVRTDEGLFIGTLEEIIGGDVDPISLDDPCTDVSAHDGVFTIACDQTIRMVSADGAEETLEVEQPANAAVRTSSGDVITASGTEGRAWVYRDGALVDDFTVQDPTDQLIAVPHADGQPDSVVRIGREKTTIQDLDLENLRGGGTLRVGLGVAHMAPGDDGLVVVADNMGSQLAIYTTGEVIRLHQTAPVDAAPWAVAWDSERDLAWIASLEKNTAAGYDLSHGVPLEQARVNTVADAQHMIALDDGTLVIGSASGDGLQVVQPDRIANPTD